MRRLFISLLTLSLLAVSCADNNSVPKELNKLTEKTEKNCDSYTEEDWQKTEDAYLDLINQFQENYSQYTDEQKKEALSSIAKYNVILLNKGISQGAEQLGTVLESVPDYINALSKAIKENKSSILKTIDDFKKAGTEIGKSLEDLGESLNDIFEESADSTR